jgi:Sec7-like guanine-nucleotide exchange factor
MAKATIKSKTGAVITVEGTEDEVSKILSSYERSNAVGHAKEAIARIKAAKRETKKREGAGDLIVSLRESGFFNKPKTLAEIADILEEKGFLYPTTTLSGVVLGLVKKRELRRKKTDGKWVYGK